jgi:hypothetical protein
MKKPMKHNCPTGLILTLSLLAGPFAAHVRAQSYGYGGYTGQENQAVRESQNVGTGLGLLLGAAAGVALSRNGSTSQRLAAGLAGAAIGSQLGKGMGRKAGERQVAKTRHSFVERSRAEGRLRSARQYNAKLTDYNQGLRNRIAQAKAGKSKFGTKTVIAQAKRKQSEAVKQASSLESYAKSLPAGEAAPVRAEAQKISSEAAETSSLVVELAKLDRAVY